MKKKDRWIEPPHELDTYIKGIESDKIATYVNSSKGDISKLRNHKTKLSAIKLFLIGKFLNDSIENTINLVYPNFDLPIKPELIFNEEETDLGSALFPKGKQYTSLKEIAYKTDIDIERLKVLLTKKTAILLASELILIEKATDRKTGELFNHLFKNVKFKSTVKK